MSEPNQNLEEFLFEAALEKSSAAERTAFLDGVCRDNPALRARLDELLEGHFEAEGFLTASPQKVMQKAAPLPPAETASRFIGRYKLLEKIGEGGFGEVWMAEQKDPVRRTVALKIIKLGMDTKQVVARFEAERQALALMDHTNIAKVFDGGATDSGRPYFVMELVRGVRITEYCDHHRLPTQERLKLFMQVCLAAQHAHQKGIIHRDIKPSNILVTLNDGVPVPKVIDFGIAKATQFELTDKTVFTRFHQFLGTPAYVSPEQASMSSVNVDTRSDIYSLGVLLYELLTGATPFDTQELLRAGLDGMRQIICERQPLRPSMRLNRAVSPVLAGGSAQPKIENQKSKIADDLDWIVMKCLEKDRARRYETANGLVGDIERHLNNEPVSARPPSRIYKFQKTLRRHWIVFVAMAAVIVALAVGVVASSLEANRALKAEQEQARQRIAAQQAQANEANEKTTAQQELYKSLVAQARGIRLLRRTGYRDEVFDLLKQARALNVPPMNLTDLRYEAMACMGDPIGPSPTTMADFATNVVAACLSPSGKLGAFVLAPDWQAPVSGRVEIEYGPVARQIELRELPSGRRVALFAFTNGYLQSLCFNHEDNQLFAKYELPSSPQLQSWFCDAKGNWREKEINWSPRWPAAKLLSTGRGVCVIDVSWPTNSNTRVKMGGIKMTDSGILDDGEVLQFIPKVPGHRESVNVTFGLLDAQTGEPVPGYNVTTASPRRGTMEYASSGDGRFLVVYTWDGEKNPSVLNLYDWESGRRVNQLCLTNWFHWPMLSDDEKLLALSSDTHCSIFSLPGLGAVTDLKVNYVWPDTFRMSGNSVAFRRHGENRIDLWNLPSGEDAVLDVLEKAVPRAFSQNGSLLLTTGEKHAQLYHLNTPEKLRLTPHAGGVPGIAFSPDGLRLASVGQDQVVRVYDSQTGTILWETNDLGDLGQSIGYSPDGRWLATGNWDSDAVTVRDANTGRRLLTLGTNGPGGTWSTQFSPDGRYLAAAGPNTNGSGIKIWEIEAGNTDGPNGSLSAKLFKSCDGGYALLFAPDSKSVTFCDRYPAAADFFSEVSGPLYRWDFDRPDQPRQIASGLLGVVQCESFLPDGRHVLAMTDTNHDIVVLDASSGKQISACRTEDSQIIINTPGAQASPDGLKIAAATSVASGTGVDILDAKTGAVVYSLPAETGTVFWLAWSPDSRRLAVSRKDGNIAIWNLQTIDQIFGQLGLNP